MLDTHSTCFDPLSLTHTQSAPYIQVLNGTLDNSARARASFLSRWCRFCCSMTCRLCMCFAHLSLRRIVTRLFVLSSSRTQAVLVFDAPFWDNTDIILRVPLPLEEPCPRSSRGSGGGSCDSSSSDGGSSGTGGSGFHWSVFLNLHKV